MTGAHGHGRPILIAGATASGKSALALDLARRCRGVVINADSMQVYAELRILTARPSEAEQEGVPHWLYGHVPARQAYSVAAWLADVRDSLARAAAEGLTPILVGGTGLYFKALLEGLSPMPPIPDEVRAHWRLRAGREGAQALHAELSRLDPETARRLERADTQRITRALEVLAATGRSLSDWQRQPGTPLLNASAVERLVVRRPRAELYARADQRFDRMLEDGALDEVRQLARLGLDPALPAMRALGVAPLLACLAGSITLQAAAEAAKRETRHYIKRQETWLKRNMIAWMPA